MNKLFIVTLLFVSVCCKIRAQSNELILIETENTVLAYTASANERVVFQYWGDNSSGLEALSQRWFQGQPDTNNDFAPQMYPAYGGRYYLEPALKLTHDDGVLTSEMVYVSHKTTVLDANRKKTTIRLKDKLYPVFVDVTFTAYSIEDVISQSVTIFHKEKGAIVVENLASSFVSLHAESYYLTHYHGTWAAEMQQVEEKLQPGIKLVESKKGVRTTQAQNPSFLISLNTPAREEQGDIYAGSLAWSGNYKLSFEVDETQNLNIIGGMNPFAANYNLRPNSEYKSPEMIMTYSSKGKGQISRNFHDWGRKYGMVRGDEVRPIILNSWEGAYFTFNEKTITDMIDNAANFGVEMFVLDDGWFGNKFPRNNDDAGLGDWQTNISKLPRGIDYLATYATEKGLRFGIWIEPEMVNPKSELAYNHPEWLVKSGNRDILPMRNQWLLDLSNPAVQDFVFNTFDKVVLLSKNISYIKWDANRHVDNVGSQYLTRENQSHFWYEYVQGLYNVYERIRTKHPHISIQLCSSGGGRVEYGALKYHDEFWPSDNTNALDRIFIQYGTNTFFPAIATNSHVSTAPNHQTGMILPLKFRFDVAMSGRLGMELQPADLHGADYDFAKVAIANYKEIRPVIHLGDIYRLVSPYGESGWASLMYVSKDKSKAVMFAYSLKYHGRTTYFANRLSGLDPKKKYMIKELNKINSHSSFFGDGRVYTGDYLMKVGLTLNISSAYDSSVLYLTEQ